MKRTAKVELPSKSRTDQRRSVKCLKGDGHDLTTGKTYQVVPDPKQEKDGLLRVIDDSGEDYVYLADRFEPV